MDVFIREEYKNILINSWRYCIEHKGLEVYGWCIMTSHVHMIIGSKKDKLENIVHDMKVFTSKSIKQSIKNHPEESRREWMLWMMEHFAIVHAGKYRILFSGKSFLFSLTELANN